MSENIIDDTLIDTTANKVIETLLDNLDSTVEAHVKTVKIPASALFNGDHTLAEMEQILAEAETKLSGEVAFTLRDLLEDMKIPE